MNKEETYDNINVTPLDYGFKNPNRKSLPEAMDEDIRPGEIMAIKTVRGAEFFGKKKRIEDSRLILEICYKDCDFDFSEIADFTRISIRENEVQQ